MMMSNKIRIARLLAEQNNSIYDTLIARAGTDTSHKWLSLDQAERLIDLVVEECGRALRPELRDMISRGQAVDTLRRHFGVEE